MALRILLLGNGGREHTLAWKLSQSPLVESIIVVPGNGGTASCPKVENISTISELDFPALVDLAKSRAINLVVPGPEAPLVAGVETHFRHAGIYCFGPTELAARLEGSKTFSKDFMKRHNIPTAAYENFNNYDKAVEYINSIDHDVVIKATGLAAGKGVIIPTTKQEAIDGLKEIMLDKAFGDAGDEVVIEEFLVGDELSILSFCDGYTIKSLPPAQDHKRIFDGDKGPNTGGMGCYSPTKIASKELIDRMHNEALIPTINGMRRDRFPFKGLLFTGFMITKDGPKVLEYNVRFGDPETETLIPLLADDCDLADIMLACVRTELDSVELKIRPGYSVTVITASGGYPGSYAKGIPMTIGSLPDNVIAFHAGTTLGPDNQLKTNGGRVLALNATADTLEAAVELAYKGMQSVQFEGMQYRKDIAHRALHPENSQIQSAQLTYAQAGVSIDAGNAFVDRIRKAVGSTKRLGADAEIGGFGGEIDLTQCGFAGAPVLVGAIDGVGTKLMIAQATRKHDTVGIDLVAMNVNDLVVQGAEPLMFLDYYGCSKLEPEHAAAFVEGVANGCRQAGCALVGGETAEMPGIYHGDDYDAAGAAIGTVVKADRLPRLDAMAPGDVLLGLASSGVHSNGFSLVRRIVKTAGLQYSDAAPWATSGTVGELLLTPTRIYVQSLLPLVRRGAIKGMAHITGGGLVDNVPRMLPAHLGATIDMAAWPVPPVFRWLRAAGNVAPLEMCRTFNNGIGMVLAVAAGDAEAVAEALRGAGETVFQIGALGPRSEAAAEGCELVNLDVSHWTL